MGAYRFVVSLLDETQEYQRFQAEEARRVGSLLGCDVDVSYAENTAILQIHTLYRHINGPVEKRPHALIVETVAGEGLERVADAAAKAGIGWVLIMRQVGYLDRLRAAYPKTPIGMAGADQLEVGRIQGRQIRAVMPPSGGCVLYVQGPADTSSAQLRHQGTMEILGRGIDVRVVEGRWTEQTGEQAVERWLRLKRHDVEAPSVVACQNDHMAIGARGALRKALGGRADAIPVFGVDGLPNGGQKHVRAGELTGTVVMPSAAGPVIEGLVKSLRSGTPFPAEMLLKPSSYPELDVLRTAADRAASGVQWTARPKPNP